MKTEAYRSEADRFGAVPVVVTSYKVGERYYCQVANQDPGAVIARAEGTTREEAVERATSMARARLA
ncbi:MAG: hypothetical protein D6743_06635 [Calditrichaeota bacterium]|nr:MAG: hypothetical protein D6743_06635 [Calditrichota bacterium]